MNLVNFVSSTEKFMFEHDDYLLADKRLLRPMHTLS